MSYGHMYVKIYRRVWYAPWRRTSMWRCENCHRVVRDDGGYPST